MKTTIGSILINDTLPEKLRDYQEVYNKKAVKNKFTIIAKDYPNQYADIVLKIKQLGDKISYDQGASFSLDDLVPIKEKFDTINTARGIFEKSKEIKDRDIKSNYILENIVNLRKKLTDDIMEKTVDTNRLTKQVASGSRGKPDQLNSMIGAPLLYADHKDRPIFTLIENNFAEGLTPVEYWASAYGTRKGTVSSALGTAITGAFSKSLNRGVDTTVVTTQDCNTENGIYENLNEKSIYGRYTAESYGKYPKLTLVTPEVTDDLKKSNIKRIKVRSPITCEAEKGICAYCRGITEHNRLPFVGENVGLVSAQTITEPITQSALSTKHGGGLAGSSTLAGSVLDMSKQMLNIPTNFVNETPLSNADGKITDIKKAPQGGNYIEINDKNIIYVHPGLKIKVKKGQEIESGDALVEEEGTLMNPSMLIKHKGLGEGRKYFVDKFNQWLSGGVDKKHFEVISRALLNKAIVTKDLAFENTVPDDIIDYSYAVKKWKPKNIKEVSVNDSVGKYLTTSIGHHLAGTKIRKSFIKDFKSINVNKIDVTDDSPPFEPFAVRLNDIPKISLDWAKRLGHTHLKTTIADALRRGLTSDESSDIFYLPLASGKTFGKTRVTGKY